MRQKESILIDPRKTVINQSSKKLDDNAIKILNRGMKFAIVLTWVPMLYMILAEEMAAGKIPPPEAADEYHWRVRTAIEKAKPKQIRQNISKAEQRSLKELISDKNIKILQADKGNVTVIMDVGTYSIKIQEIMNAAKYKELKKDLTASVESKIQQTVNKYISDLHNQLSWQKLTPRYTKPPHFYGLRNIHKPGTPLRPIVSSRNFLCHPPAKFLLDIIGPLPGNTQSATTNIKHFINQIKEITIDEHDKLVSFEVTSLFTNVPTEAALAITMEIAQTTTVVTYY
ncbi:hypothetical protein Trydic_g11647 [Trypoxylus dichotomus]